MFRSSRLLLLVAVCFLLAVAAPVWAGSIVLTGHDPDFHAYLGSNATGARNINTVSIGFIMDPAYNPFVSDGITKFLFVQSSISPPGGHTNGKLGIIASGYVEGTDFEHHDASTLNAELDLLGTKYSAIVVASDFGGILTQAELDILNARSSDIIDFLNAGGGIYALAESNSQAHLTPDGGHFGFLPFVVTSTQLNQGESGFTVTPYGAGLGLANTDVNGNASHNIFLDEAGLNTVDIDANGNILTLAGRGAVDTTGVLAQVPFDIHPTSCPNPLSVRKKGLVPAAILGTEDLDVTQIDPSTLLLEGVPPKRWSYEDVATPVGTDAQVCECNTLGPDGFTDLTLKFMAPALLEAIGPVNDGDVIELTLSGAFVDGTEFRGVDCMVIRAGGLDGPGAGGADARDGLGITTLSRPSEPVQKIEYALPDQATVRLDVYSVTGRLVKTLAVGSMDAGSHVVEWDTTGQPSGMYFYRLQTDARSVVRKVALVH